jgi:tetratricopeptide (TPR) repeat protein
MAVPSIAALLQEGLALHREGALEEAVSRYAQVLRGDPANVDGHYHLARARCEQGHLGEGIGLLRQALTLDPTQARIHALLGMALSRAGRHAEALASLDRAVELNPSSDAYGSRADALVALGRPEEAVESYDRALALKPDSVEDWCNRGAVLLDLGRSEAAVESFDRVLALAPDFAEAHCNRGSALARLGRQEEAFASYDRALALNPNYADALNNRANALDQLGRQAEALTDIDRALALVPAYRGALVTRSIILRKLGRSEEALATCEQALAFAPKDVDALIVRGDVLIDLERFQEAVATLDEVIAVKPDAVEAKWNKSLICLGLGRFEEGWALYEHRWAAAKGLVPRLYRQSRWNGRRLDGTLLVWSEQGLGDEILHSSMIPELTERTPTIVLEVEPRLVALFARSFQGVRVIGLRPDLYAGHVDAQEPLGGLGRYFRTGWDSFPRRERGYLLADGDRAKELRGCLTGDGRLVIGLSWISRAPIGGKSKSAKLSDFEPLLRLPGCRFVDLQYGDTFPERAAIERELGLKIERLADIDNTNDLDGLAALMTACDAVVTVSNTTAHLAGALGRPTWVMVPYGFARIWYWFKDKDDSPWYPRVRVQRQRKAQPWSDLISSVTGEVSSFVAFSGMRP